MPDGFAAATELANKIADENKAKVDAEIKSEEDRKLAEANAGKSDADIAAEKIAADEQKKKDDAKKLEDDAILAEEKRLTELAASSGKTVDVIKAEEAAEKEAVAKKDKEKQPPPDAMAELLKELNFTSKEDLVKHLKKADEKQKSPDEIKRAEQVYTANMNAFAVENNLMTLDDVHNLEKIRKATDEDLVYKKFAEEAREEILAEFADDEDPTEEEILAKTNESFEKEYPRNSKNKNAVTRAENKIKREAELIRQPLERSYEKAKERYDDELGVRNAYPEYQKTMKKMVDQSVPSSVPFFKDKDGENEISIEVPLSEDDRKEILEKVSKKFQNPETFLLHQKGKTEDIEKMIQEEVEYLSSKKVEKEGKKLLAERYESIGKGKGSKVGAENSFETNQSKKNAEQKENNKVTGQDAIKAAIDSTRVKK